MNDVRLSLREVHKLASSALLSCGISPDHAIAIADVVTSAERDDCKSHGLFRIPTYIEGAVTGVVEPKAVPELEDLGPAIVRVNARGGYAPLAIKTGSGPLAVKARKHGIAALAIIRCCHVAALWPEVEHLAKQGFVILAFTTYKAVVAPAGGTKPIFGTNPMAFGWPRLGAPPMVFDQASSVKARGELLLHQRDGEPIPEGWAIDTDGNPTSDPTEALAGAQLPFGDYKGAAIALMIELLAGPLIGEALSLEASGSAFPIGGEFMIAIDPLHCVGDNDRGEQLVRAERLFSQLLEQEGVRLPSDRRYAARQRNQAEGVMVPQTLHDTLVGLAQEIVD